MRRLFIWIGILVFLSLAALLIALAAVKLIPQARLRKIASERLGQRLNRQIEIGPLHWRLSGLDVDDLRISEVPGFHAGTFITAKGVKLGWDLRPLWVGFDIKKKVLTRSSGRFHIDQFHNPHYAAQDFSLRWSLTDIDPTGSHLNGWAALEQGKGLLENIDQLIATTPSAKVALMPVTILLDLDRLGFVNFGLPDLRHWPLQSIQGHYLFTDGLMTIQRFSIASQSLTMEAAGAVELKTGAISLEVELRSPPQIVRGALEVKMHISGTVSHPKVDLQSLKKKAFRAALSNLLPTASTPKDVNDVLKKLLR